MKKGFIILFFILPIFSKSQAYETGDVFLNVNIGGPQVTPALIRVGINLFYKNKWVDNSFKFSIKNSGVLNCKTEYAVHENLGLGIVASYWNMDIDMTHTYNEKHPATQLKTDFTDNYHFDASALAFGVRGNYHLLGGEKRKVIDPYTGLTFGITRYSFNVGFNSDFPDKLLPNDTYSYKSGWGTYFSGTIGLRIYPVKNVGLNMEAGWDRGAFLFGGIVFKIHTNPPQFLKD
jgi:hypothetical protein